MRILITGAAGFVGSNVTEFLKEKHKKAEVIALDNLYRPGSKLNLQRFRDIGVKFVKADIRDKRKLLEFPKIDVIVECSAVPSVLASANDPDYAIETNFMGVVNCLDLAKRDNAKMVFLSTNRVYPVDEINKIPFTELKTRFDWKKNVSLQGCTFKGINEKFPLTGVRTLYGASKLCSEHIIQEYIDIFQIQCVINRCGIISGPWQFGKIDQGLVGYWVGQHKFNGKLKYLGYNGSGKQVRDAVHVKDLCELISIEIENSKKLNGKVFNVGGGRKNSFSLLELTKLINDVTKCHIKIAKDVERVNDIRIWMTDNSFVTRQTGWSPKRNLEEIVVDISNWIDEYKKELAQVFVS